MPLIKICWPPEDWRPEIDQRNPWSVPYHFRNGLGSSCPPSVKPSKGKWFCQWGRSLSRRGLFSGLSSTGISSMQSMTFSVCSKRLSRDVFMAIPLKQRPSCPPSQWRFARAPNTIASCGSPRAFIGCSLPVFLLTKGNNTPFNFNTVPLCH